MRFGSALLFAALALAALFFLGGRRGTGPGPERVREAAEVAELGRDELVDPLEEEAEEEAGVREAAGSSAPNVLEPDVARTIVAVDDDEGCVLEVVVLASETGEPVPYQRVVATQAFGPERTSDEVALETVGTDGTARLTLVPGNYRVGLRVSSRNAWLDDVKLAEGAHERIELSISLGGDETLFGRVEIAGQGPVSGATVRIHSMSDVLPSPSLGKICDGEGLLAEAAKGPVLASTTTEPGGVFRLPMRSWDDQMLVVEGSGVAPARRVLGEWLQTSEAVPLVVRLVPLANYRVRVLNEGLPVAGANVHLHVRRASGVAQDSPLLANGCPQGETDARGDVRFADAPSDTPFVVQVRHGTLSRDVPWWPRVDVHEDVFEIELGGRCELRGRVEGTSGRPMPDVLVQCSDELLNMVDGERVVRTEHDGTFVFSDLWPGPRRVKCSVSNGDVRLSSVSVDVPSEGPWILRVPDEDLFVSGRVLGPSGEPVPGAFVYAQGGQPGCTAQASAGQDGGFQVGPLLAGTYELVAIDLRGDQRVRHTVGNVVAGTEGVILRPESPSAKGGKGTVRVRFEPVDGTQMSVLLDGPDRSWLSAPFQGTASFEGVAEGRYSVCLRTATRVGYAEGIDVAAGAVTEVFVRMDEGGQVRARWNESGQLRVWRGDILLVGGWGRDLSQWSPMPPGRLRFEVHRGEEVVAEREVDLAPGARVEVDLRQER